MERPGILILGVMAAVAGLVAIDLRWGPHARLHAGDQMPAFELSAPGGDVFRSSDHAGKVILVSFFASW